MTSLFSHNFKEKTLNQLHHEDNNDWFQLKVSKPHKQTISKTENGKKNDLPAVSPLELVSLRETSMIDIKCHINGWCNPLFNSF